MDSDSVMNGGIEENDIKREGREWGGRDNQLSAAGLHQVPNFYLPHSHCFRETKIDYSDS